MEIELKDVHVGSEIAKRIGELGLNKSEFARRIGVQQQHVNRILERETMETNKLVKVCRVLDINIFAKFCSFPMNVGSYLNTKSTAGYDGSSAGNASVLFELELQKTENRGLQRQIELLKEQVAQLQSQMEDKNRIISILSKEPK